MIGKNNNYLKNVKNGTKVETYSIKKFKIGAASVVIGAGIFFGMISINSNEVKAADEGNKITENATLGKDKKVEEPVVEKDSIEATNSGEKSEKAEETALKEEKTVDKEKVETPKTVGIPATNTEPKEGTNSIEKSGARDPRNGQPLGEARSDFREGGEVDKTASGAAEETEKIEAEAPRVNEPPLSTDDQHNHYKKFQDPTTKLNKNLKDLNKQLFFIDWTDKKAEITGLGEKIISTNKYGEKFEGYELKVGATWKKEITDGYIVTVRVKELKNILGEENGLKIQKDAENYNNLKNSGADVDNPNYRYNSKLMVYKENYNTFSAISESGLTAPGYTTISGEIGSGSWNEDYGDHINSGITFEISATYKGKSVKPAFFAVSAEEAGDTEVEIYKTNGKGWELLTEIMRENTTRSFEARDDFWMSSYLTNGIYGFAGYSGKELSDKEKALLEAIANKKSKNGKSNITTDTISEYEGHIDGLGTQTFGPVSNHMIKNKDETADGDYAAKSTPIIVTRGATEISAYLISNGAQAFTFGVMALDEGDAPSSYGDALHLISKGRAGDVKHPYLGSKEADIDEVDLSNPKKVWKHDGVTGEPDEGPDQLVGDKIKDNKNYTLYKANDGSYKLDVLANRNGNDKSYVKGWIDFNGNGKFDEDEASKMVEVTEDGHITLEFSNKYQNVSIEDIALGMRVRTALNSSDIEEPTGYAFSGEVEDFKIQQTLPPRGEKKTSIDEQGKTQNAKVEFNAYGKVDYDNKKDNSIDLAVAPKMVKADGNEIDASEIDADGYFKVAGEGKYKVTADGKDVNVEFVPEENFIGKAKGVLIRRTDVNKTTTGWGKIEGRTIINGEGTNKDEFTTISDVNTMDGVFIPIVTPKVIVGTPDTSKNLQNTPQEKTLVFKNEDGSEINPAGVKMVYSLEGANDSGVLVVNDKKGEKVGEYSIDASGKVTFTPVAKFVDVAPAATVVLTITPKNMEQDTTLTEDDKKALAKTAKATYTPTVVGVVPTAKDATTKDIQGEVQTAKILLNTEEKTDDTTTVNFDKGTTTEVTNEDGSAKSVDLDEDTLIMLNGDSEVTEMDAKAGDKVVGKYKLDKVNKTITFTPNKDYDGKTPVTPATLRILDINGGEAKATYTPTVVGVVPTAKDATTKDIQGEVQTGKPEFKAGSVTLNEGEEPKTVELDDTIAAKLVDSEGKDLSLNDKGEYVVEKVGTYKVAEDGTVTFTPEKTFKEKADGVLVRRVDKNGTPVDAKYTPEVVPVTPTATPAETEDVQGMTQTAPIVLDSKETPDTTTTVNFEKGSTVVVEGEDPKTVDLDETTLTLLDGNSEVTELTAKAGGKVVGKYTLDKEKKEIKFIPTPEYDGTTPVKGVTIQIKDKNGTKVTTTYTPKVVAVTITPKNAESTKVQGLTQSGKPTFEISSDKVKIEDYKLVDPKDKSPKDEVVIEGKGKYKVASDGTVTFIPEPGYIGDAPIEVVATDSLGRPTKATYTPKTTEIEIQASDIKSKDIQGEKQSESPRFILLSDKDTEVKAGTRLATFTDYKLIDPDDNSKLSEKVEVKDIGTYKIDKDGKVTFTPEKTYKGEVPTSVGVRATLTIVNEEGTTHTLTKDAKYTPKVVAAAPTAEPKETKDIQGATQTGKPDFKAGSADVNGDEKEVPLDDTVPAKLVDDKGQDLKLNSDGEYIVKNVGKYKVAADGTVTFTPELDYVGKAEGVLVRRVDKNGTAVDGKYTPTVVPVTPTATPAETEDVQGMTQTAPIILDEKEETDNKATVNFDKGIVAALKDENGNPKTVDLDETTLTLLDGNSEVTELDAKAGGKVVGKYTLDKEKKEIKFIPTPEYDGTTPVEGVTIQIKDKNGTKVTTTYTPKVVAVKLDSKEATSTGVQGAKQTGTPTFTTSSEKVTFDNYKLVDPKTKDSVEKVVIENEGSYTIDPNSGEVTFIPEAGYVTEKDKDATGVVVRATASNKLTKDEKYTPKVEKVTAEGSKKETIGKQGATQKATPIFTISDESHVKDESGKVNVVYNLEGADAEGKVVVENEGTYTINANSGEVTFKPLPNYITKDGETAKGVKVKATYTLTSDKDKDGKVTTSTIEALGEYVPKVTPVTLSHKDSSSIGLQGKTQTGTPTFTADDKEVGFKEYTLIDPKTKDPVEKVVIENEGTYIIDPNSGKVTFIPEASYVTEKDKKALGVVVRATATNTLTEEAKYIPEVTAIEVIPVNKESIGVQGEKQNGTPVFTIKDEDKVNITEKVYSLEGADATGKVVVENEGSYTINPTSGEVTFTPMPNYVTKDGAKGVVVIQKITLTSDKNDKVESTSTTIETKATYTPKVVGVMPTANPSETTGMQGAKQISKVVFDTKDEDKATLNFDKGSVVVNEGEDAKSVDLDLSTLTLLDGASEVSTLEVKDKEGKVVGTYTIDKEKGEVVFQPKLDFVGVAPSVWVQIKDKNGTVAKTTYTPTITPLVLSHEDVVSEKVQGVNQKGTPIFKESTLPENVKVKEKSYTFADGTTTTKEVENEGVYTINPQTGEVTFSPRGKDKTPFVGTATGVEVKATYTLVSEDKEVKISEVAKYTPTVLPLEAKGEKVVSENLKGKVHEKDTIFTAPKLEGGTTIDKVIYTFEDGTTEKVVKDEGKYEIGKDGKVIFTPLTHIVGELQGVKVKATYVVRSEGGYVFEVLATGEYVPVIKVATPTSKDVTSVGPRRKAQNGTPIFTPATATVEDKKVEIPFDKKVNPVMVDEKGDEVKLNEKGEYVVAGEGKYIISADGVVTFTPEDDFTGVAIGVWVRKVDEIGNSIIAKYTPTVLSETIFIDKDGKELLPPKEGEKDKEDIAGYRLVETKKDEKGNVTHIYEKVTTPTTVTTRYVDKEGKELLPPKEGEKDKEDIAGYRLVETKKDEKGNVIHIYEKVTTPTTVITRYVDKEGKELLPPKEGTKGEESITGYKLVRTEVDSKGNTIHIYEKVTTPALLSVKPLDKDTTITKSETSLPNTDVARTDGETAILTALGLLGILGVSRNRRKKLK